MDWIEINYTLEAIKWYQFRTGVAHDVSYVISFTFNLKMNWVCSFWSLRVWLMDKMNEWNERMDYDILN